MKITHKLSTKLIVSIYILLAITLVSIAVPSYFAIVDESDKVLTTTDVLTTELKDQSSIIECSITSFRDIVSSIEEILPQIEQINGATKQIDEKKEDIIKRVEAASAVAEETSAASAEEMNSSAEEVSNSSKLLNDVSQKISAQLNRFKV